MDIYFRHRHLRLCSIYFRYYLTFHPQYQRSEKLLCGTSQSVLVYELKIYIIYILYYIKRMKRCECIFQQRGKNKGVQINYKYQERPQKSILSNQKMYIFRKNKSMFLSGAEYLCHQEIYVTLMCHILATKTHQFVHCDQ